jgi:hypothetical protein
MKHAARSVSLAAVLISTGLTFGLGVAQKSPCLAGDWQADAPQYRLFCYTDIVPLVVTEQLAGGRLPFLDRCAPSENNCDEYPVLTMYLMRLAAWAGGTTYGGFYAANALLLGGCAIATAYCLWRLAGRRALWFAFAPTLLLYGTINWDLLAVMLATAALAAYAARQDEWSGGLVGLGAAAKLYPGLFTIPLFLQGLRDRTPDRSVRILWWSVGAWLATNVPFAIVATTSWWTFFRFNATRPADFDSLWYIACDLLDRCPGLAWIGLGTIGSFVVAMSVVWWAKVRRQPGFPPWTLCLPALALFLMVNKVYSPQFSLWLLPLLALLTGFRLFIAFQVADVLVFLTRLRFFGTVVHQPWGWPEAWLQWAVGVRWVVLVLILVDWVRRTSPPLAIRPRPRATPTAADTRGEPVPQAGSA